MDEWVEKELSFPCQEWRQNPAVSELRGEGGKGRRCYLEFCCHSFKWSRIMYGWKRGRGRRRRKAFVFFMLSGISLRRFSGACFARRKWGGRNSSAFSSKLLFDLREILKWFLVFFLLDSLRSWSDASTDGMDGWSEKPEKRERMISGDMGSSFLSERRKYSRLPLY